MIKIKANIELYKGKRKRKTSFYSGYRPLFEFKKNIKTSGQISLIDKEQFEPGMRGIVFVIFVNKEFLGKDLKIGKAFRFYESEEPIGEGEIIDILVDN